MRIVTRPDFDGIVCAVLLSDALQISEPIKWVEPNAMQHGLVEILPGDVIANLAYFPTCELWFDHHESNRIATPFHGVFKIAPSAAGIVFEYFKHNPTYRTPFSRDYTRLVEEIDKIDSAALSLDEVLHPGHYPYVALSTTISSHNRADEPYWNLLVKLLRSRDIEGVLKHREVKKRMTLALKADQTYRELLQKYTKSIDHVTITDFRPLPKYPSGNRFLVFSLFPQSVVNLKVRYESPERERVVLSIGHSIFNRNCQVSSGELSSFFGGGGHRGAGSSSVPAKEADEAIATIVDILLKNEPASFPILFEDDYLIAVNKPAGLLSEGNRVVKYQGELTPVFPLEREMSGVVLFAKHTGLEQSLLDMVKRAEIKWMYFAVVEGHLPEKSGTIADQEHAKNCDANNNIVTCQYRQLKTFANYSLLTIESCAPQNQNIRRYMAKIGFPVTGDIVHGAATNPLNRLALHAYFITFTHPITKEHIVLETPVPRTFLTIRDNAEDTIIIK